MDWDKPWKPLRLPGHWFRILEVRISNVDLETNFESVTLFFFLWFCSDHLRQYRVCTYRTVDRFFSRFLQSAMVPPFNGVWWKLLEALLNESRITECFLFAWFEPAISLSRSRRLYAVQLFGHSYYRLCMCKDLYCERQKRGCFCASKCHAGTIETK